MTTTSLLVLGLALLLLALSACGAESDVESPVEIAVVPRPLEMTTRPGAFTITAETVIHVRSEDAEVRRVAGMLSGLFEEPAGFTLPVADAVGRAPDAGIVFELAADVEGQEGYRLDVEPHQVRLSAATPAGLFYGIQTVRQLLPVAIDGGDAEPGFAWTIPCVHIVDRPRFGWRGQMLDVSRHMRSPAFIRENLDLLARYKLNVFHWHLTDDQGWRIEIEGIPALTTVGAWRADRSGEPWHGRKPQQPGEATTYGGYFTQEQIRELIAYARDRFITIVPEIDMPGHSRAAIAACPEISCDGGTYTVATGGVATGNTYCPGKEATFSFVEQVLGQVMALFPSEHIHIGGDECSKEAWGRCPDCRARMEAEGLESLEELQSYFIRRVEGIINERGRSMIGWDEILEGGLAPNAVVMSWRGEKGGIAAAQAGHQVIMTPHSYCYLDLKQGDPELEPPLGYAQCRLSTAYSYDPVPDELTEAQATLVLGSQGNLWSESIETEAHAHYMLFPRLLAIAETTWTPAEDRTWDDFVVRLEANLARLERLGIGYARSMYQVALNTTAVETLRFRVAMSTEHGSVPIHYTVDGTDPSADSPRYTAPLELGESTQVKACAIRGGQCLGPITDRWIRIHRAAGCEVELGVPASPKYPGRGGAGLVDCHRGGVRHADEAWLGFEAVSFDATLDLGASEEISKVTLSCLESQRSWIFLPDQVEVLVSEDGASYEVAATRTLAATHRQPEPRLHELEMTFPIRPARFVRIRARNIGSCPEWHRGAGGKSWVFVDEVLVD